MDFEQQARDFLTALGDFEKAYNPDTDSWVPKEAEQALVEVLEATYKAGQESQGRLVMIGTSHPNDFDKLGVDAARDIAEEIMQPHGIVQPICEKCGVEPSLETCYKCTNHGDIT